MLCWHCGEEVVWQGDFSFKDFDYEEEGIVTMLVCSNEKCGAEYQIKKEV